MSDRVQSVVHKHYVVGCVVVFIAGVIFMSAVAAGITYALWENRTGHVAPTGYAGDPARGKFLVTAYGCPACHAIPGAAPRGLVGPSLEGIARRSYVAGHFANQEIWMTLWLEHPEQLKPGTAMPDLNVGRRDSLDMAAYLATLR